MFNPNYDPMAQLEQLQQQVNTLTMNNNQLAQALNHQANAIKLLNQQVNTLNNNILVLDTQHKLISAQLLQEAPNART